MKPAIFGRKGMSKGHNGITSPPRAREQNTQNVLHCFYGHFLYDDMINQWLWAMGFYNKE